MKEWCRAADLAGLPGMPSRSGDVPRLMKRLGVESREKQGQGGGMEYMVSALPAETRAAIAAALTSEAAKAGRHEGRKLQLAKTITQEAAHNRRLSGLKQSLHQPVNGQRRIDAKLQILSTFEQFHKTSGLAIRVSRPDFARRYNAGEIAAEPWVRGEFSAISDASIWRWQRAVKQDGIARLAGGYGNRRGDSIIERQPELHEFVVSMLVTYPHTTMANVLQGIRARFNGHNSIDYPSPRALQRWVFGWKRENKQTFTALTNPDAWKSGYMVAFGSHSADIERVNQRWEMDSTPGDVMLTDGRHVVIGVIDVRSRRSRLLVSKTSKATAIATLLRHALLAWGVPEVAKTDNGTDYTSNHIKRVFAGLEVEHELCPPFQPWHKPHIERFFGTFSHGLVELLPGFIGHNVAERKEIEARRSFADRLMKRGQVLEVSMSSDEFQRFCDDWCEKVYAHAPHEGLKGKTPFEVVAANRDAIRKVTDERALDVLLADAPANNGKRTVQKKGILLDGAWFIAPELEAHVGEDVFVRLDPLDLGRIYVFDAEEGYVCTAEAPERTGMDRQVVAAKAREMQKGRVQDERAALKAVAKRVRTDDIVREVLLDRAEASGKLARLPGPSTTYMSGGLTEGAKAARVRELPAAELISPAERAALDAEVARAEAMPATRRKVVAIDDPEATYRRWLRLDAAIAAGRAVSDEDRAWHAAYRGSDEWRAMKGIFEDFPDLKEQQG